MDKLLLFICQKHMTTTTYSDDKHNIILIQVSRPHVIKNKQCVMLIIHSTS